MLRVILKRVSNGADRIASYESTRIKNDDLPSGRNECITALHVTYPNLNISSPFRLDIDVSRYIQLKAGASYAYVPGYLQEAPAFKTFNNKFSGALSQQQIMLEPFGDCH